jgi:6-pyruvoyltetrahydropterin/6-carboxytetrahydropterin synthase
VISLTRIYRFEAAHRLVTPALSDEENRRIYGKCCREGGHGHNYEVEVTVSGEVDARTGFLLSREEMDRRVRTALVDRVDHRNLNDLVDPRDVTTGENLATLFWSWLEPRFVDRPRLTRIRVLETARNRFETTGEEVRR